MNEPRDEKSKTIIVGKGIDVGLIIWYSIKI